MLEEKDLILATKKYALENRAKSWMHLWTTTLLLGCSYIGILLISPFIFKIILGILTGLTIVRLFIMYHDYLHRAILRDSKTANVFFTIFGLFILAPKSIWKRSHDHHHKHNSKLYTSSIGSFPIVTKKKFHSFSKAEKNLYLFIRHPLTIAFGYITAFIFGMCLRSFSNNPRKHWDSLVALILHFAIGTAIVMFAGWQVMFAGFLLPAFITFGIGSYLFYAQHNFPGVTFEEKDGWTYMKAAMNSSSYMKMNPVMQWFTGNIGFHHIHHANARIPFYRLPEVFEKVPEFRNPKTTSLHPLEIARCLRLKVWDPETRTMIGKKELYNRR